MCFYTLDVEFLFQTKYSKTSLTKDNYRIYVLLIQRISKCGYGFAANEINH